MDAFVGVAGSAPAYVFLFIEAMADAAVMVNRPCAGHHGNEGSPLQPIAHLVDIGKAGPFQLKRPIAGSFHLNWIRGRKG